MKPPTCFSHKLPSSESCHYQGIKNNTSILHVGTMLKYSWIKFTDMSLFTMCADTVYVHKNLISIFDQEGSSPCAAE